MAEAREALRHEESRPSLGKIAVGAAIVGAGIAISIGVAAIFVAISGVPASGANNARRPDIAGPVLETNPRNTIEEYRREKHKELDAIGKRSALPLRERYASDSGQAMTLADALGGKPAVLVLGYLRCSAVCPTTLEGITEALDSTGLTPGRDYRGVFASVDPRDDTIALAAARAARISERDRGAWRFVGGDSRAIAALATAARFDFKAEGDGFAHPAGFTVIAADGTVARHFDGVRFDAGDLRAALRGGAGGGSLTDRIVMMCSHLDPLTGRYSAAILATLRIGAILAIALALAALAFHRTKKGSDPFLGGRNP